MRLARELDPAFLAYYGPTGIPSRWRKPPLRPEVPVGEKDAWAGERTWGQVARMLVDVLVPGPYDTPEEKLMKLLNFLPGPQSGSHVGLAAAGILAGKRGAVRTGGGVLSKFLAGEKAAAEGASPQRLWHEFGYWRGPGGQGRWEISDVPAKLKMEVREGKSYYSGPLEGVLEHEEFFKAYPKARNLDARIFVDRSSRPIGGLHPDARLIHVVGRDLEEAKRILMHELQHAVQFHEGFPLGSNLRRGIERYRRSGGEVEAENVEARLADPELMGFHPGLTARLPEEEQILEFGEPETMLRALRGRRPK